jgi:hypothetical protein
VDAGTPIGPVTGHLEECRKSRAVLLIARLDRLARTRSDRRPEEVPEGYPRTSLLANWSPSVGPDPRFELVAP